MELFHFTITDTKERLDKLVHSHLTQFSRVQIHTLIKEGKVMVNGSMAKPGEKFKGGELVRVELPPTPESNLIAEDMPLNILYEDDALLVLDKPAGLVVHPGTGNFSGTLVHGLLGKYPELAALGDSDEENEDRVGIVHRLDKETSGLMVVGRTMDAVRHLSQQFQERLVDKMYIALLEKQPKSLNGIVDAPIARDARNRKRMSVQANGRPARSQFEVTDLDFVGGQALVKVTIFTGRTHQIRVHMAFIGCPVVGDILYGRKRRIALDRQFLHATHLAFNHPVTGERMAFDSPLPEELVKVLGELR